MKSDVIDYTNRKCQTPTITLVVGCVGGRPVMLGMLCSESRLLVKSVCGGVERMWSGVSGVGGEYTDWETAGT